MGNFSFTLILSTLRQHALELRTFHKVPLSPTACHSNGTHSKSAGTYNSSGRSSEGFSQYKTSYIKFGDPHVKPFSKNTFCFPLSGTTSLTPLQLQNTGVRLLILLKHAGFNYHGK